MMDESVIFDSFAEVAAMWCPADLEAGDLARATENLIGQGLSIVSVVPSAVPVIWPWLEQHDVKILARFYMEDKQIVEKQLSDLTKRINDALRRGAHGAQVFVDVESLTELVEQTYVVRDDLFFNKDLVIGLDILGVGPFDWEKLYANLRKINASAVAFVLPQDTGKDSMIVGQVFAMLNAWNVSNNFDVHLVFGQNFMRIEQVLRMIKNMRPELVERTRVFMSF